MATPNKPADTPAQNFAPLGNGLSYAVVDNAVILRIPCDAATIAKASPSKTGKNRILATTSGFASIPGTNGVRIGLNVIAPL